MEVVEQTSEVNKEKNNGSHPAIPAGQEAFSTIHKTIVRGCEQFANLNYSFTLTLIALVFTALGNVITHTL